MKTKVKVKYLESGYYYKRANSKCSEVVTKKVAPIVDTVSVTENTNYVTLKNSKYSVTYNKLSGKTEVNRYISSNLSRQSVVKSFPVKELQLSSELFEVLRSNFQGTLESLLS